MKLRIESNYILLKEDENFKIKSIKILIDLINDEYLIYNYDKNKNLFSIEKSSSFDELYSKLDEIYLIDLDRFIELK